MLIQIAFLLLAQGELSAAGGDINPSSLAQGRTNALIAENLAEGFDAFRVWWLPSKSVRGVHGNQIERAGNITKQLRQGVRLGRGVVFSLDKGPFKEDASPALLSVFAASVDDLLKSVATGDGHEHFSFGLRCSMQRHCQTDRSVVLGELPNTSGQPYGGHGDVSGPERDPVRIGDDVDRLHHPVVVVEGFAHAHENDVAQVFASACEIATNVEDLGDNFASLKMAAEAHLPGGAKHTSHGTSRLRTHTGGKATLKGHGNRLNGVSAIRTFGMGGEEKLSGMAIAAVDAGMFDEFGHDGGAGERFYDAPGDGKLAH